MILINNPTSEEFQKFYDHFKVKLSKVPELRVVFAKYDGDITGFIAVYKRYLDLANYISTMSAENIRLAELAKKRIASSGSSFSATTYRLGDLHESLASRGQRLIAAYIHQSTDIDSPETARAMTVLADRMLGGHKLKAEGKETTDGDQQSDAVIWNHTTMTEPISLLHFTICHYLERVLSCNLAAIDVPISKEKDYYINAMVDAVVIDHLQENLFSDIFKRFSTPKPSGGLGWRIPELLEVYSAV